MTLRVFCDFDGTLVPQDVGNAFFRARGGDGAVAAVREYRAGRINARECLLAEAASVGAVSAVDLESFADAYAVDPFVPGFIDWCRRHGAVVTVVSDGLDIYVRRILANAGLGDLPVFANQALFGTPDRPGLSVGFPWRDETCEGSGNCKRNHLVVNSGDDDVVVYVGDGLSDRCAVPVADIVFAKGSLVPFCQEQNITYHVFRDFRDVHDRLARMVADGSVRQRREAAMARRAVFIGE